jgi:hypothetical protein
MSDAEKKNSDAVKDDAKVVINDIKVMAEDLLKTVKNMLKEGKVIATFPRPPLLRSCSCPRPRRLRKVHAAQPLDRPARAAEPEVPRRPALPRRGRQRLPFRGGQRYFTTKEVVK